MRAGAAGPVLWQVAAVKCLAGLCDAVIRNVPVGPYSPGRKHNGLGATMFAVLANIFSLFAAKACLVSVPVAAAVPLGWAVTGLLSLVAIAGGKGRLSDRKKGPQKEDPSPASPDAETHLPAIALPSPCRLPESCIPAALSRQAALARPDVETPLPAIALVPSDRLPESRIPEALSQQAATSGNGPPPGFVRLTTQQIVCYIYGPCPSDPAEARKWKTRVDHRFAKLRNTGQLCTIRIKEGLYDVQREQLDLFKDLYYGH